MLSSGPILSILGFLAILAPLVVVHELGHFLFARLFKVKAEIFSIGFGPRIWHKQIGETDFRISAIPLGGFVKLLGEDRDAPLSAEERKRALYHQALWKRFFIFFGGPLFNFLYAILVFMAILLIGEPQMASVAGRVVRGSVAEQAGFRSGDRILSVNAKPVRKFEEVMMTVSENPGRKVEFEVVHAGSSDKQRIEVVPSGQPGFSMYGESTEVGEVDGLFPMPRGTHVGISNPQSAAAKAGLKTGDVVTEFGGKAVSSWEEIESIYQAASSGATVRLRAKRGEEGAIVEGELKKSEAGAVSAGMGEAWGFHSSELFVEKVIPKSPAEEGGVQAGDRLVSVGSKDVQSFFELRDAIQRSGETSGKVAIRWERDGKILSKEFVLSATDSRDPLLKKTTQFTVGVAPMLVLAEPEYVIERVLNPFMLLYKGTERMVSFTWRNFVSVGKMFTGDVSAKTLGGPILIGKIAGESLARGLISFLSTMALLSIGLGVLNILPVPVLDGGHIMLLLIESVRGKPLTMRQMERVQGVGLVLVLSLMGFVLLNDITRLLPFSK